MVRWRAGAARASIGSCKTKPQRHRQPRAFGRSSIERLPPELREAVDAAIADGATIDEIADLIRGEGGACSRSAVGRYTKNVRDLILRQQETDRANEMWVRALGERAEGRAGLILIETLRTMTLSTMAEFAKSGEPVPTQELARLSLILKRIEGTDKLRLQRERAAAKEARAAPGAGQAPGQAPPRKGLSPETVDLIDEAVVGFRFRPRPPVTSVPTDPWAPAESRESHLIPLNPGESRPENVPEASAAPGGLGQSDDVPHTSWPDQSGHPGMTRSGRMDRIPQAAGHSSLSLSAPHSFPSGAGRSRGVTARVRATFLATRIRARRSRAVRAASQPGPPRPCSLQTRSFPSTAPLRTCGPAHFPLSPLRPLGPEKEKGADTAFGPPPPSRGMTEGDARNKSGHDEVGGPNWRRP